jgi:MFS transporter, MHS family, proline/betaine transporter
VISAVDWRALRSLGAVAPSIATFLVRVTDNSEAPAAYVIIAAIITLVVLLRTPETAFAPLR